MLQDTGTDTRAVHCEHRIGDRLTASLVASIHDLGLRDPAAAFLAIGLCVLTHFYSGGRQMSCTSSAMFGSWVIFAPHGHKKLTVI